MDDHEEIERRSRAMVEAQRPVRYWVSRDVPRQRGDEADLDELERRAAALEVQVAALEVRSAIVRAALGRPAAQGPTNSAMSSSTTSPQEASTSRNRRITVA